MKNIVHKLKSALGFSGGPAAERLPFDLLLQYFREVLDAKNRAMELIADMGEKLSGDYLFDIIYIRNTYAGLHTAIKDTLGVFDRLTRGRYSQISDVFERIDRQIKVITDGPAIDRGEQIIFLQDFTWDMARAVGGKNAGLGELKNYARLNVPEGFAVTTQAFDDFISYNNLAERIQALGDDRIPEKELSDLHDAITRGSLPPELAAAIDKALSKIREKNNNAS